MLSKPWFGLGLIIFVIGISIGSGITAIYLIYSGSGVSVINGIASIFGGAIGPLISALTIGIGGVIATYLWWRYRMPELKLGDPTVVRGQGIDADRSHKYRINIKNDGRRAATNCKARLTLEGQHETERYQVETLLEWSQGEQTISINAGEEALVEILTVRPHIDGGGDDTPGLPRIDGGEDNAPGWDVVFMSGLSGENQAQIEAYNTGTGAFEETWMHLPRDDLLNTDFTRQSMIITAENCQRKEFRIDFQANNPLDLSVHPT